MFAGHRLSQEGLAVRGFKWQPAARAHNDLVDASEGDRIVLANAVLRAAQELNLVIADGRGVGLGLSYFNDIEHLLADGVVLPDWLVHVDTLLDGRERRYLAYRALSQAAKG
jgi:hypothetical protein